MKLPTLLRTDLTSHLRVQFRHLHMAHIILEVRLPFKDRRAALLQQLIHSAGLEQLHQ
jgi:hypothetical protein